MFGGVWRGFALGAERPGVSTRLAWLGLECQRACGWSVSDRKHRAAPRQSFLSQETRAPTFGLVSPRLDQLHGPCPAPSLALKLPGLPPPARGCPRESQDTARLGEGSGAAAACLPFTSSRSSGGACSTAYSARRLLRGPVADGNLNRESSQGTSDPPS